MQLKQIGAVFIIAFMFTGMFGFVMNTEMVDVQTKSYSTITPGESIVFNSGVTQWEEYNPVQNLTGVHVLQKQTSVGGDPFPSNVVLPLTDTPSKYVYNRAFAGYHSNTIRMNALNWNYSANCLFPKEYEYLLPLAHYIGYEMYRMAPGIEPGRGESAFMKVTSILYTDLRFTQWWGFKLSNPNDDPHPDIDWQEMDDGSWQSIPLYGGGYGVTNFYRHGAVQGPEQVYEIRSCFEIYQGRVADDAEIVHKYYNNPKEGGYVILYPLSDTLKNKEDKEYSIVDGTVIGTSSPISGSQVLHNLYGLVYAGNGGQADIHNDDGYEHMSEVSEDQAELVKKYASLTYTYKLNSLDDEHTAWVYDEPTRLYYPAIQLADGQYVPDKDCSGARCLVFMEKGENVADGKEDQNALKKNWSARDENVPILTEPDYPSTNYDETDIPILTVFIPETQPIKYIDPQKWDILNDPNYTYEEFTTKWNGALQWDNGERTGIIKYWGQVGLRLGTDDTHQHDINKIIEGEVVKEEKDFYGIPHSRVWWSVPENPVFKYDYYICTIDLLHKTATCEGVIGEPTSPLEYVLSGTVYDMEAHSDVDGWEEGGTVPKYKWPEYFDAGKWKEDNSYSALVTYTDYDVWKYGPDDASKYQNLRFYVLSTTVATDPHGKLWGDPQFYLGYYVPDVFGGEDKEYVWDKDGDTHITAHVLLTNNNGRFFIKSAVQYGTSFIINNQEFQVSKDGLITIEYNGKSYQYPVDDVQFEYLIQKDGNGKEVGTKIYLVLTDYSNKSFPVGGVVGYDDDGTEYSWEEYSEMRGWVDPTIIKVPIKTGDPEQGQPVVTVDTPRGTVIKGEGSWYFLSNIDLTTIIQQKEKRLEVDSGKFTLTVQSAVMIFLGVSLVGLAGLCYYTNQRIPLLGWVAVGGVVLLSLSIMFAMS